MYLRYFQKLNAIQNISKFKKYYHKNKYIISDPQNMKLLEIGVK